MIIKVDRRFSFLTDYSLNFQHEVTNFTPFCCLKNSHHKNIKLFQQNLVELRQKQIKLFTFLHLGFLSNDAVNDAIIALESLGNSEQENIRIFWCKRAENINISQNISP